MTNVVQLASHPGYRYVETQAGKRAMRALKPSDYCRLGDMELEKGRFFEAKEHYVMGGRLLQKELERQVRNQLPPYGRSEHRPRNEILAEQERMNLRIDECDSKLGIAKTRRDADEKPALVLVKG